MFKTLIIASGLLIPALSPVTTFAHGNEDARVEIEAEVEESVGAGKVQYKFQIVDSKQKIVLKDTDLSISHEKKLHFVAYDKALKEFQHVHPEFIDGMWVVELEFNRAGSYWLWAQGKIVKDGYEFSASSQLKVSGGDPANPIPAALKEIRKGADGTSAVALSNETLRAKKMAMLTLSYSRKDGSKPEISPYLGAKAHVFAVPDDGDSVVHVHPMDTAKPNELMIHATFPAAGMYRVWIEFVDGGAHKRVPLAVKVVK